MHKFVVLAVFFVYIPNVFVFEFYLCFLPFSFSFLIVLFVVQVQLSIKRLFSLFAIVFLCTFSHILHVLLEVFFVLFLRFVSGFHLAFVFDFLQVVTKRDDFSHFFLVFLSPFFSIALFSLLASVSGFQEVFCLFRIVLFFSFLLLLFVSVRFRQVHSFFEDVFDAILHFSSVFLH